MIWTILNIEETKNKKAIMRAYREKLSVTNPEEKPEEFKKLRAAYEEALRLADLEEPEVNMEISEEEKTPLQRWTDMLSDIYFNMDKRQDLDAWRELLSQDFCLALDTRKEAEDAMLKFFMDHYRVPHKVWLLLNEYFHFLDHEQELYETFPGDFIRYIVIDGMKNEDYVPYHLLEGSADGAACDEYISLYYRILKQPFEQSKDEVLHMEAMPVRHPYVQALIARYHISEGKPEALEDLKALYERFPEKTQVLLELMWANQGLKHSEDTISCAEKLLEMEPNHRQALYAKAYAYADMKDYQKAADIVCQLMDLAEGNQKEIFQLAQIRDEYNKYLIEEYEKTFAEDQEDAKTIFDLTWAYFQNEMNEKAIGMLPYLKPGYPNDFRYTYTCALLALLQEDAEEASRCIDQLAALDLEGAAYDYNVVKRNDRVANTYIQLANLLKRRGQKDEAVLNVEKALAAAPGDVAVTTYAGEMFLLMKMYSRALDCGNYIIQERPWSYHGHYLAARAYFYMRQDQDSFQALNQALELDQSDLWVYLLKLRILERNDAYEGAESLINYLEEEGVKDHPVIEWMKAEILRNRDQDYEASYAIYEKVHEQLNQVEEKPDFAPEFYYNMAINLANKNDARKIYDRDALRDILDLGLAVDPEDMNCLNYKAWLLKRDERIEEAIVLYKKMEELQPENLYKKKQLAEVYYEDTYNYAKQSLFYYEQIREREDESVDFHQNIAYLYYLLGDYENAINHTRRAQELDPESEWNYYRFSIIYAAQKRITEALEYAKLAVKAQMNHVLLPEKRKSFYWTHLANILRRMGRVEDAIEVYRQCQAHCPNFKSFYRLRYETYMQAGIYAEAKKILDQWKKADPKHPEEWAGNYVIYHLLKGEKMRASLALDRYRMDTDDRALGQAVFAAEKGNFTPAVMAKKTILERKIANKKKKLGPEYSAYAFALWMNGEMAEAKKAAEEGLRYAEEYKSKNDETAPIATGSGAVCLAILGRIEEARQEVELMNHQPVCFHCTYSCCKDYYVYLARVEIIAGELGKAKQIIEKGKTYDYSEDSYLLLEAYIKKKGKSRL